MKPSISILQWEEAARGQPAHLGSAARRALRGLLRLRQLLALLPQQGGDGGGSLALALPVALSLEQLLLGRQQILQAMPRPIVPPAA
jgi:hypothetical protein